MVNTPAQARLLCCLEGMWQLIDHPRHGTVPPPLHALSAWEMQERIAVLEASNEALRAEARTVAGQARSRLDEVEHRLMNTFVIVQALAAHSARRGDTGEAFRAAFGARLLALARSHELLGASRPDGAPLDEIVGRCLRPYEDAPSRVRLSGPLVHLPARNVPALGLAFHELATNAAKHGALSVPEGRVEVAWRVEPRREQPSRSVAIVWCERGGPPVRAPERRGFGSRWLEGGLLREAGGTAQIDFAPHGVDCRIWLPLAAAGRA